jgi:phosphonate transport system permease protein
MTHILPVSNAAIPVPPPERKKALFLYLLLFSVACVFSYHVADIRPLVLCEPEGQKNLLTFLAGMFPPALSWDFLSLIAPSVIETIQIALLGTALAVLIGFPLGLMATSSLTWSGILHQSSRSQARRVLSYAGYASARTLLNMLRSIPELIWAFMFVRIVGLGPLPGVLAIGIAYGGMLGKIYAEILESTPPGPLESFQATGASEASLVAYGLLPQALPNLMAYTLYRWECAIRASAILGVVGAGGIGQQIEISMRMFNFHEVLTLICILGLLVVGVDALSARVRKALV